MFPGIKSPEVRKPVEQNRRLIIFISLAVVLILITIAIISFGAKGSVEGLHKAATEAQVDQKFADEEIEEIRETVSAWEDILTEQTPTSTPTSQPTATPMNTNTPTREPTSTPAATSTPEPTATPVDRYELTVYSDQYHSDSFVAEFTFPREEADRNVQFRFIDARGHDWPHYESRVFDRYGGERVYMRSFGECYMPWGTYEVEVYMDEALLKKLTYEHTYPEVGGEIVTAPLSIFPPMTKTLEGWEFVGISGVREDTYLLEIVPIDGSHLRVRLTNKVTGDTASLTANYYELIGLDLYYFYYDKSGDVIDAGGGGIMIWPAELAYVTEGGAFSTSQFFSVNCDQGTIETFTDNLPSYFRPYQLPDGTWVDLIMVNQEAYTWLMANRQCPSPAEFEKGKVDQLVPTPEPTPEVPKSLSQAPFDKVTHIVAPALDLSIDGVDLLIQGQVRAHLAGCNVNDPELITAQLYMAAQEGYTIIVWLWDGFAHTFETSDGKLIWSPCIEWEPPTE